MYRKIMKMILKEIKMDELEEILEKVNLAKVHGPNKIEPEIIHR